MTLSRRLVLLAAAGLGLPGARARAAGVPGAAARLRRLAGPAASARALGLAYLARRPEEASPSRLTAEVVGALGLAEAELAALDDRQLRARLGARIRAEFAAGQTESAGGWILSRTEARLLALAV